MNPLSTHLTTNLSVLNKKIENLKNIISNSKLKEVNKKGSTPQLSSEESKKKVKTQNLLFALDHLTSVSLSYRDLLSQINSHPHFITPKHFISHFSELMVLTGIEWNNDFQDLADITSKVIKIYREFPLWLATAFDDPPDSIMKLCNLPQLNNPTEPIAEGFKYNPLLQKPINNRYRYLINMSQSDVKKVRMSTPDATDDMKYNYALFRKLAYQSRWGSIWQEIISAFLYKDTMTMAKALENTNFKNLLSVPRYSFDLLTLKTIAYILKRFNYIPFNLNKKTGIVISEEMTVEWGLCLVPLLYSLLELSKEEKGCNYVNDILQSAIEYRLIAAQTSFETVMLDNKSIYSDAMKLVTFNLGSHVKVAHQQNGVAPLIHELQPVAEISVTENEYNLLLKKVNEKAYPGFTSWLTSNFKNLKSTDPYKNTEHARFLLMICNNFGNPGIYYKTSLILEAVKSIEAQHHTYLNLPSPSTYIVVNDARIPVTYRWDTGDEIWKKIQEKYNSRLRSVENVLQRNDFMEWFVHLLTNRSQGEKVEVELQTTEGERAKLILSVRQARVAAFTLDTETYFSFATFVSKLAGDGVCTIRFQNNRRARIVEIVPNLDQTAYATILRVFNEMKVKYDGIAVGKQGGGVFDMELQLSITGNPLGVCASSDVAGMDTSTQPFISQLFGQLLAEYILHNDLGPEKYFAFTKSELLSTTDEEDIARTTSMPALAHNLYMVLASRLQKKYILKDDIFNASVKVGSYIFESGRFDTSAQHTVLLDILADIVIEKLTADLGGLPMKVQKRKFGDDSFEGFIFGSEKDVLPLTKKFVELEKELLRRTGFELEIFVSRFVGDFLQQLAFNGCVVPKSARSSVYTDERGNTQSRSAMDVMQIVGNVFMAASQRCYSIVNVQSCILPIWIAIRTRALFDKISELSVSPTWSACISKFGKWSYFTYPLMSPFLPPNNFPHPSICISDVRLLETSTLTSVGDIGYVWLFNSTLTSEEKFAFINLRNEAVNFSIPLADKYYLSPSDYLFDKVKNTSWFNALIVNNFNRNALLSSKRKELLALDINQMAATLREFYSNKKLQESYIAWEQLKTKFGIEVPLGLTYWSQPLTKIETMFSAITESELEAVELDNEFSSYLLKYSKVFPAQLKKKIDLASVVFEFTPTSQPINTWNTHNEYPLIPGSIAGTSHDSYGQKVGTPFINSGKLAKVFQALTSQYGSKFDLQSALKYGQMALKKGENAFSAFISSLALDDEAKIALRQDLLTSATFLGDANYVSGFSPAAAFDVNGSNERVKQLTTIHYVQSGYAKSVLALIARDIMLLAADIQGNRALNLFPSVASQIKLESAYIHRRLGIKTV